MNLLFPCVFPLIGSVSFFILTALPLLLSPSSLAGPTAKTTTLTVAVAANFVAPAEALIREFEAKTKTKVLLISGSTGKLVTQIQQDAPFDVFLSADQDHITPLVEKNVAISGSQFTYAIGKLFLYSATPKMVDAKGEVLKNEKIQHLAIANPELAPYGAAAKAALVKLNLWPQWEKRLVVGDSIAQAFQFVATGNAEIGFIAGSQIKNGSAWEVPDDLYPPLKQDAILLKRAAENQLAKDFLTYLRGPEAQKIIAAAGYRLSNPDSSAKGK